MLDAFDLGADRFFEGFRRHWHRPGLACGRPAAAELPTPARLYGDDDGMLAMLRKRAEVESDKSKRPLG